VASVLACALLGAPALAQPRPPAEETWRAAYTQRAWAGTDGLPPGTINDLAETRDGHLWLATYGGLVRFDGVRFTVTDSTTMAPLASNQVSAVAPAADGALWVAPVGASVFRTDGRRPLEVLPPRPNAREFVHRLRLGPDGALWVVSDTAVERFAAGAWTDITPARPNGRQFRTLLADRAGGAWLGASDGVFRVDRSGTSARVAGLPAGSDVHALVEDRQGRIWVGGTSGLAVILPEPAPRRARPTPGVDGRVTALAVDAEDVLWVATPSGVQLRSVVDGSPRGTLLDVIPSSVFDGAGVEQFMLARSGAVVAATPTRGFHVFTRRVVDLFGPSSGLPGPRAHHVVSDGADGLWVGTGCGGLTHVRLGARRTVETFGPPSMGLRSSCVRGLLRDRRGDLWVGQAGGALTRISARGAVRTWTTGDGLPPAELGPLLEARDGRTWVGSRRGVLCLIGLDERVKCPRWPGEAGEKIWSLAEGADGSLWVGQVGRLTRIGPTGAVQSWGPAEGLPPSPIRALHGRPDGTIWMATYGGGLARLRDGRIVKVGAAQGLADTALSALVTGGGGTVWLLGNRGVFITSWPALDAVADGAASAVEGAAYGAAEGMPEGNGGHPSSALMPDGRIGFATVEGLALLAPGRRPSTSMLVPHIDEVNGAMAAPPGGSRFVVPPGGGPVTLGVAAPFIGAPGSVRVRYRLQGRDQAWRDIGMDRRVTLDDLSPGDYVLDLSARHADGPWSVATTVARLTAQPFWWETRAAQGLGVTLLAGSLTGGLYAGRRARERRRRDLAREVEERKKAEQAAQRHLFALAQVGRVSTAGELAASLAHELGQPLTAIVANAEASRMLLDSPTHDPQRLAGILGNIAQQGQRASDVVRSLRAFLSREAHDFALVDVNAVVREVLPLLDSTRTSTEAAIELDLADTLPSVPADRVPLQQVVLNLALNALEAMRDSPSTRRCVLVRTRHRRTHVTISVSDTGPGLPLGTAHVLFEPLYTTKVGGMGMGLAISRSIVEAHGGRIRARNRHAGGATFVVSLPIDRASGARA
jgi:signal transduction histidine kinase/ligand-binding sensor domain-containing protein